MSKKNFVTDCINADALLEEIDNYIDDWHSQPNQTPIYEYLGMTQKEYRMWVENDWILKYIIIAHLEKKDIDDVLVEATDDLKMVARAATPDEAKFIYIWLVKTGRIKE